jgi:hypothetical protein
VHTAPAGINQPCLYFHDIADVDGVQEPDPAYINGYAILTAPVDRACIGGLVNPFHDGAAMYFTAEIDVRWFTQKTKGDDVLLHEVRYLIGGKIGQVFEPVKIYDKKMRYQTNEKPGCPGTAVHRFVFL